MEQLVAYFYWTGRKDMTEKMFTTYLNIKLKVLAALFKTSTNVLGISFKKLFYIILF